MASHFHETRPSSPRRRGCRPAPGLPATHFPGAGRPGSRRNCFSRASAAPTPATPLSPAEKKALSADVSEVKTADQLWQYIQEWANKEPDIDKNLDDAAREQKITEFVESERARLTPACEEFLKKYPQDPRRWDVRLVQLSLQQEGDGADLPAMEKTLEEIADAAPDASATSRQKARQALLGIHLQGLGESGLTPALESEISAYEKDFPDDPDGGQFVALRMHFLGENPTPEQITELLTKLSKSPNAATAKTAKAQLALRTEPLDLKFTAVDGREVDLAKLRGKVVLVDFWATWCGPCVQEVPDVVAAFKKYHDKGFEIVGISLDKEKDALEKFTKAKEMTWPQYFDGKFWQNDFARRFGIDSIPAMWLVGTDGKIASFNAREDLDGSITKLLDHESRGCRHRARRRISPSSGPTPPAVTLAE